jgi:hypothetical protein
MAVYSGGCSNLAARIQLFVLDAAVVSLHGANPCPENAPNQC